MTSLLLHSYCSELLPMKLKRKYLNFCYSLLPALVHFCYRILNERWGEYHCFQSKSYMDKSILWRRVTIDSPVTVSHFCRMKIHNLTIRENSHRYISICSFIRTNCTNLSNDIKCMALWGWPYLCAYPENCTLAFLRTFRMPSKSMCQYYHSVDIWL